MSKIKVGLCCRDVPGLDLEEQFAQAQRLGFKYVQIALWKIDRFDEKTALETKAMLEKYDLECTEVWVGWVKPAVWDFRDGPATLGLVPADFRLQRIQNLLEGAAYARILGVKGVLTHVGFIPVNPFDPDYRGLVIALKHITAELAKYGQYFSLETGQETPIVAKRCLEDVAADNLFINYDPANIIIYGNGNPIAGLDVLGKYVKSVHGKDANQPLNGYEIGEETVTGEGQVNIPCFVEKLKEIGFEGIISIEHERHGVTPEQKEAEIIIAKNIFDELVK